MPATALARVPLLWAAALGGWQRRVCVIPPPPAQQSSARLSQRASGDTPGRERQRGTDLAWISRIRRSSSTEVASPTHESRKIPPAPPCTPLERYQKRYGPHCPPQFPYYVFKQRISSHRMIRRVKNALKTPSTPELSCRGRPSLPPRTTAQRRVHEPPDAGGGLDSRGVRSPTGEHETRAKDHAWRRKGRITRVAERLLLDVGGEGKRSLPRALF